MMFGRRILILAAHPDDEVVACAAAIGRAQAGGAAVSVLFLTHGCIAREVMWPWDRKNYDAHVARRRAEGEKACAFLDITPVGWSVRPARHLWRDLPAVHKTVEGVIAEHAIDQLWAPAYEGGNPDHDGLNAVASLFGGANGNSPRVLEFAEYNFNGGKAHSQAFPFPRGAEQTIALTSAERQHKLAALGIYVSEKGNLDYVEVERECFRPLIRYDYNFPPHGGTLWYARFQWVPFRHPRVDFTRPDEVSAAIADFLRTRAA
ncbi:MAG: PIG-L deacetylase family protein [Bdellovibrionales bacterium]